MYVRIAVSMIAVGFVELYSYNRVSHTSQSSTMAEVHRFSKSMCINGRGEKSHKGIFKRQNKCFRCFPINQIAILDFKKM